MVWMAEGMEELRRENERLRRELEKALRRIAQLEETVARQQKRIAELEKRLRPAETAEAREGARLFKVESRHRRRPPGPPEGHPGVTRPPPDHVDEEAVHELRECPECHGPVEKTGEEERFTEEFVPARVKVTKHRISRYMCRRGCGHFSAPDPTISGSPFGPNLHAHVALMRHLGIPFGKIGLLLKLQHGLEITKAALIAMVRRVAAALEPAYEGLRQDIRKSAAVEDDETGWRVDGRRGYLFAFTSAGPSAVRNPTVLYTAERGRRHKVVERVLGRNWGGVFIRDGYPAFDKLRYEMQVCLVHLKRNLLDVEARRSGVTRGFWRFARWLRRVLNAAIRWNKRLPWRWRHKRAEVRAAMEERVDRLTAHPWRDPDAKRICKTLRRHRNWLFTFLTKRVPYHTNGVEREIRPCVVTRRNSHGSKSRRGARDTAVVMSVAVTCRRRGRDFLQAVQGAFRPRGRPSRA